MCVLLTAGAAMAQKRFTFGPKIGVDLTHFWGENVNHGIIFGYQAGLFAEYSIDLGPQLGINVYSKYTPKGGSAVDINYAKSIDFGVGLGATYNIANDVFVQARYTLGVTEAFKVGHKQKNGNAQIAIGYRF